MPQENITGHLKVSVRIGNGYIPVTGAKVFVQAVEGNMEPLSFITDSSGQTPEMELPTPPRFYSESPDEPKPYAEYVITVEADGYETAVVEGTEILPGELSLQTVQLQPLPSAGSVIIIPDHVLYGDYESKTPEAEVKPVPERGEIVLSRVVIPEYIVVHDGAPTNSSAPDYWVRYTDYIKNVASSEIYATWEDSTILANILAIQSFTLNRVYTEYYRSRGYDFTITSSTAYDQKFVYGRNIYDNISYLVDQVFNNYLARPGVTQPIFTSYCDGQRVTCSGLSQWGSKYLGDEGYSAIEIIRYYYGPDMYIATAEQISGVPASYPGYDLTIGSSGDKVRQLQQQLNRISQNYPAIPQISADGIYGSLTAESVRAFQKIFDLPQTGVTDFPTWYAISRIYVAVSRISEPGAY
ncbi:MAG: peptidoglycan-binding protein [Lachnospiraceae bacterium]|nr:peptidoglycan-binding protein [Lachnospiraceae bacterium]